MPYTKILPADPQPPPEENENAVQLPSGEWWMPAVLLETGEWIAPDEVAVQLDTGERVALACIAANGDYNSQTVYLTTTARLMDAEGGTAVDGGRNPAHIATSWIHGASLTQVDSAGGLDALRTECLRLALGEDPAMIGTEPDLYPLLPVAESLRSTVSIRRAIAAASQLAAANDSSDLL